MISHPPELVNNLRKVEETTDRLGNPIDEDIKLLVAALWSHDVPTSNSCAGHIERHTGGPFVEIESPDASAQEQKLYSIQDEDKRAALLQEVKRLNLAEQGYVISSLDEFYANRRNNIWTRLIIETRTSGRGRLICQGAHFTDAFRSQDERKQWLASARQEMADFTQFLIKELEE